MRVSIIAAMDRRGLIGDETGLPWHLPKDLRRFRAYTWGKPVIMGRRTFKLIGKPFPGRFNIVLTRDYGYVAAGCQVAHSFEQALSAAEERSTESGNDEVMVIGGGEVYRKAIQLCDRLYLTLVEGSFQGTTRFPVEEFGLLAWPPAHLEVSPPDERNPHKHLFLILERAGREDVAPRAGLRSLAQILANVKDVEST
jgi:dihydrofolate reductase